MKSEFEQGLIRSIQTLLANKVFADDVVADTRRKLDGGFMDLILDAMFNSRLREFLIAKTKSLIAKSELEHSRIDDFSTSSMSVKSTE